MEPGLTPDQRSRIECYQELVEQITVDTNAVLAIANQLATATIETFMVKSDLEVGIQALLRGKR